MRGSLTTAAFLIEVLLFGRILRELLGLSSAIA
jgi:hypothetical protein